MEIEVFQLFKATNFVECHWVDSETCWLYWSSLLTGKPFADLCMERGNMHNKFQFGSNKALVKLGDKLWEWLMNVHLINLKVFLQLLFLTAISTLFLFLSLRRLHIIGV